MILCGKVLAKGAVPRGMGPDVVAHQLTQIETTSMQGTELNSGALEMPASFWGFVQFSV